MCWYTSSIAVCWRTFGIRIMAIEIFYDDDDNDDHVDDNDNCTDDDDDVDNASDNSYDVSDEGADGVQSIMMMWQWW